MSHFKDFEHWFEDDRAIIWRHIFESNQDIIKVKKEKIALPNLRTIINSTLDLSNRSSFRTMSLRELSQDAGISMGSLYSYIESKERLLAMILGLVFHLVNEVLDASEGKRLEPKERLRWLLRRHIFLTEVMQPWFFFAYMEAKGFDRRGKRMAIESELRTQGLIASCLTAGQASGVFRPLDPDMTASLIKPLLQDWYLKRWKYRGNKIMPDDYAAWVIRFVEAFVDRVRATPPRARDGGLPARADAEHETFT